MSRNDLIRTKLDKLIDIMLTDGVQPSDLADNVFLDHYCSISYNKQEGRVTGELVYYEEDPFNTKVILRYYYDGEKKVERIEEDIQGSIFILWDRSQTEKELLDEILSIMQEEYNNDEIATFITSLPENLRLKINSSQTYQVA